MKTARTSKDTNREDSRQLQSPARKNKKRKHLGSENNKDMYSKEQQSNLINVSELSEAKRPQESEEK